MGLGEACIMNTNEPTHNGPANNDTANNADTTRLPEPPMMADGQPTTPMNPVTNGGGAGSGAVDSNSSDAGPADAAPAGEGRGNTKRSILIGAAIAAGILLIGGGGVAIGVATADRDAAAVAASERPSNDLPDAVAVPGESERETTDDSAGANGGDGSGAGSAGATVPADAAALVDAIDVAVAAASGKGATAIDVEHDGWEVDVQLSDGTDVEMHVALDGTATVRDTDDDRDNDPLLDTARVPAIVDAALAAAGGGTIESISTDDDSVRYDVSVDLGNGEDVEVELSESLEVISVDRD